MGQDRFEIADRLRDGAPCTWEGLYRAVMGAKPPAGTTLEQDAGLLCGRLADLIEGPPMAETVRHDAMEALEWVRGHGGVDAAERRMMPEGMEWPRYADGEPVRIGDEVHFEDDGGAVTSIELQADGFFLINACDGAGDHSHRHFSPGERVKRTDPDSWERVEADARKDVCDYFARAGKPCEGCPSHGHSCHKAKARDLVRRCRALAERDAR